jgi:hypothetical protein
MNRNTSIAYSSIDEMEQFQRERRTSQMRSKDACSLKSDFKKFIHIEKLAWKVFPIKIAVKISNIIYLNLVIAVF